MPNCGGLVDGAKCLTDDAAHLWRNWKQEIWLPPAARDASLPAVEPYSDPSLVRRPRAYAEFVHDLLKAGICKIVTLREAKVGIYFVRQKDGRLRMIMDARVLS